MPVSGQELDIAELQAARELLLAGDFAAFDVDEAGVLSVLGVKRRAHSAVGGRTEVTDTAVRRGELKELIHVAVKDEYRALARDTDPPLAVDREVIQEDVIRSEDRLIPGDLADVGADCRGLLADAVDTECGAAVLVDAHQQQKSAVRLGRYVGDIYVIAAGDFGQRLFRAVALKRDEGIRIFVLTLVLVAPDDNAVGGGHEPVCDEVLAEIKPGRLVDMPGFGLYRLAFFTAGIKREYPGGQSDRQDSRNYLFFHFLSEM